jgi:hypothetical protein
MSEAGLGPEDLRPFSSGNMEKVVRTNFKDK